MRPIASEGRSLRAASTIIGGRVRDQRLKDCPIHIRKLFDVEASLSCVCFPSLAKKAFASPLAQHAVQNKAGLTQ
jgi:hypothetical protein